MRFLDTLNDEIKEYYKILCPEIPEWLEEYIETPEMMRIHGTSMSCGTDYTRVFKNRYWYSNLHHSIGVALIVMGLINAVSYFKETKSSASLILGTVEMAIGIFLIVKSSFLKEFISFIIGVYILLSSIAKLVEAIDIQKETGYSQKRSIILSAIGMGIAILCGIGKIIVPDMFLKLIGLLILIYGIINIVNLFILNKTKKDNKLLDIREVKVVEEKTNK